MSRSRIVMGIDPGTAIMGYGIVEQRGDDPALINCGAITTSPNLPLATRLHSLHRDLTALIERFRPSEMAVEALFFNSNVRTALAVGHARGVALLAAAQAGLTVDEYAPLQVKQAVAGYGRATKEQIQKMLPVLLGIDFIPQPDDAADAVAIAICHLHFSSLYRAIAERQEMGDGVVNKP